MHRFFLILLLPVLFFFCTAPDKKANWKPVEGNLMTRWAADVTPENVWPQYPRPMMRRAEWQSLNGLWKYAIRPLNEGRPETFDGHILVPFPIQSALSGVKTMVGPDDAVWYQREVEVPRDWKGRVLLNFEASDWQTTVWVDQKLVGENKGGYHPFSFDITEVASRKSTITIKVSDPTDTGWQPVGKQVLKPGGIFYTAVTGLWQTIWMEPVSSTHIVDLRIVTDVDRKEVTVSAEIKGQTLGSTLLVTVTKSGETIFVDGFTTNEPILIPIPEPELWSPSSPALYDLNIQLLRDDKVLDKVDSYFGMRKIELGKDANGFTRITLNGEALFQNGPLDQGFWPDGIYTAPTEEALRYDLEVIKKIGFNMLRKHVKIEPRRFYYLCDSIGLLVWQDMPNGDKKIAPNEPDIIRSEESDKQFRYELEQMVTRHINHPSIIIWVPFNEGWGQYNTAGIVDYIKSIDSTRLVINTSGWSDRAGVGDIHDIHSYPDAKSPEPEENRAIVLGEFGGLGFPVADHLWEGENWGYQTFTTIEQLTAKYEKINRDVFHYLETTGLSASVYTQTTDVETETNGLMTYDREVLKIDEHTLYLINTNALIPSPEISPEGGLYGEGDEVTIRSEDGEIFYTLDGSEPDNKSSVYDGAIILEGNTTLKARAFNSTDFSRVVTHHYTKTDKKRPIYSPRYNERYSAGGDYGLIDEETGSLRRSDGKWQGWEGIPFSVTLDLGSTKALDSISFNFLSHKGAWILLPKEVTISVSDDGKTYTEIYTASNTPTSENGGNIQRNNLNIEGSGRYLRLAAKPSDLPEGHDGYGKKAWIFLDEISVR